MSPDFRSTARHFLTSSDNSRPIATQSDAVIATSKISRRDIRK
jgi:hypothetical protein